MEIRKWHVYIADLNPRMGTEPGKVRPVIVVQTDLLNGIQPRPLPLDDEDPAGDPLSASPPGTGEAGGKVPSDIMVDQVRAIDNRRLITRVGVVSRRRQVRLASNLRILLT